MADDETPAPTPTPEPIQTPIDVIRRIADELGSYLSDNPVSDERVVRAREVAEIFLVGVATAKD